MSRDQLFFLFSEGYTAKQIAEQLHCSTSVVYKRMHEEGLKFRDKYTTMNDTELSAEILSLSEQYPNSGSEVIRLIH